MRNALALTGTVVFALLSMLPPQARAKSKSDWQQSQTSSNYTVSLNGTGAYISVSSSESLNITGAFTVEAWIKTNSNTVQQGIVERYNWLGTASDGGYGIRLTSDGRLQLFTVQVAGVADGIIGNAVIRPGVWHHVAGVFDGYEMRIYLNGVLDGSKAAALAPGGGTNSLKIGARGDVENFPLANALTFNGLIDDVRLTSGVVYRGNFNPRFPLTAGVVVEALDGTGIRGYWDFNDRTVNDSSGHNNHGTLLNGAYYSIDAISNEETVWVEDALPAGASTSSGGINEPWNWVNSNPSQHSGVVAHQSPATAGLHQQYFQNATQTLTINPGEGLMAYVYLDPNNSPSEIMLQWHGYNSGWEHRAYWGMNNIPWGVDGTNSRRYMGTLPAAGGWVRLQVPASEVGLEGQTIHGLALTLYGGRATWDRIGKSTLPYNQPGIVIDQPQVVNFEGYSLGTYITSQYAPSATFAAIPSPYYAGTANVVVGDASGANRPGWKAIRTLQGYDTYNVPLDIRFPRKANNLHFYVLNAWNYYGAPFAVCKIQVYRNDSFYRTFDVWSPGTRSDVSVDFSGISDITGLIIYDIRGGLMGPLASFAQYFIYFDDFEFTSPSECPSTGATASTPCPTPTPTPTPTPEVTSVSFENAYLEQLSLNPNITLDGDQRGGCSGKCGMRIFPDKQSPTDTANRATVKVRANTTYPANTLIYFRSFDLDDPSTDLSPVDPNGHDGNDNRGGGTGVFTAHTDSSGIARIDFSTSKYPGDNYMIAASADQAYLNSLTVDGIRLRDPGASAYLPTKQAKSTLMLTVWRNLHVEVDSMGLVAGNSANGTVNDVVVPTGCPKGSTNTVCRDPTHRIVFVDQPLKINRFQGGRFIVDGIAYNVVSNMENSVYISTPDWSPGMGRPFTLYDDDDFNLNNGTAKRGDMGEDVEPPAATFSLMQHSDKPTENVFATAYIRPVYDGGGNPGNNTSDVPFNLNIVHSDTPYWAQIYRGMNSEGDERDDFWIVYLQIGYQGPTIEDYDPNDGGGPIGTTRFDRTISQDSTNNVTNSSQVPKGAKASFLYVEMIQEAATRNLIYGADNYRVVAPHEVGHQFGLAGDTYPPGGGVEYGIMSYGNGMVAVNPPYLKFAPAHLNMLRWRVKSPGQL